MLCRECGIRPAIVVPDSILPICVVCSMEKWSRPPPADPVEPPRFREQVQGQLGLFGQVDPHPAEEHHAAA